MHCTTRRPRAMNTDWACLGTLRDGRDPGVAPLDDEEPFAAYVDNEEPFATDAGDRQAARRN
jgi:hypothetical protein